MRIRLPKRPVFSREIHSIEIEGERVRYTLQRSSRRRRTIQLQVDSEPGFKVLAPHTLTLEEIEEFLVKRSDWILRHRVSPASTDDEIDWSNGGTAKFMGRDINVVVKERDLGDIGKELPPTVVKSLEGDTVTVIIPPDLDEMTKARVVRDWLADWYRQEAWDHLKSRVAEFGEILGVRPNQLKLSNAKKRWGSCSERRSINLNWRLIMLEDHLIDYVVAHELAHLVELNHSDRFWRVVGSIIPDHKELRRQLREYSPSTLG